MYVFKKISGYPLNIVYHWELSMPHSVFGKHVDYTSNRSWSTRVRFFHSWAASGRKLVTPKDLKIPENVVSQGDSHCITGQKVPPWEAQGAKRHELVESTVYYCWHEVVNSALLRLLSMYILVYNRGFANYKIKLSNILYHW